MLIRPCLCIPTFNNPKTIADVILGCLSDTKLPLVVIDDGSDIPVEQLIPDKRIQSALFIGRLSIVRFEKNLGKGHAIQHAFQWALQRGYTHLITIDGDGQHPTDQISHLVDRAHAFPMSLVIGNRKLPGTTPGISRFGRKFSNFWVKYVTSLPITDSQSGFRVYPLYFVQDLKFFCKRFDFEIEVLVRLLWKGVDIQEPTVATIYQDSNERVRHFNFFTDNVRITALNICFIVLSLFKSHRSPLSCALAVGSGVLIGCSPLFGLHTFIAMCFSFFFRLNFPLLWIGTQVSIPPLAPLVGATAIYIGSSLSGAPFLPELDSINYVTAASYFGYWMKGGLILGLLLGGILGMLAYLVARLQSSSSPQQWTGRSRGGWLGYWTMQKILKLGGLKLAYRCLFFIVPYFYLFAPKGTRAAHRYWRRTHPKTGFFTRVLLVLNQYFRFGQIIIDRLAFQIDPKFKFETSPNGMENIQNAVAAGKGVLLISAHVGSWDMAANSLRSDGLDEAMHMVHYAQTPNADPLSKKKSEEFHSIKSNEDQFSVFAVYEAIRAGKPIGLMGDRTTGKHICLVPFFNGLAAMNTTPFQLAQKLEAPWIFTVGFKTGETSYNFYAKPPRMIPKSTNSEQEVYLAVCEYAKYLEAFVKRFPEQWFNFFDYWNAPIAETLYGKSETIRSHSKERPHTQTSMTPA